MNDIDIKELKSASNVLRAITHPLRIKILGFISKNEPVNVSAIYKKLNLEQSVTSSHLSILRKAGFLLTSRDAKKIFYSINNNRIEKVLSSIQSYFL